MSWINLPLYDGFDTFAIWPSQETVSVIITIKIVLSQQIFWFYISIYHNFSLGIWLLWTVFKESHHITSGYRDFGYIASLSGIQICCIWFHDYWRGVYNIIPFCSNSNLKAGTLTIYTERPETLIYHDR